jgi:cyclopropane fatty-acyl-phospholipid synthase-like methyltransferase
MPELKKFGVASKDYPNAELAKGDTYTRLDGSFPSTNLACEENPYKDELKTAKYILDFGCGVGRNIPWIMENTTAIYVGLDPNTTMTNHIWDINDTKYKDRTIICNSFDEIPSDIVFDYVVSTFVLQHLGYRYNDSSMNITDITQAILKKSKPGTIFFHIEHDSEEEWIGKWKEESNIELDVYIRTYKGLPELADRDHTAPNGGHHLMIWKNK